MKIVKLIFYLTIASIAVVSCKTYFEGEKVKFHTSPVYRNTPLYGDSINPFKL